MADLRQGNLFPASSADELRQMFAHNVANNNLMSAEERAFLDDLAARKAAAPQQLALDLQPRATATTAAAAPKITPQTAEQIWQQYNTGPRAIEVTNPIAKDPMNNPTLPRPSAPQAPQASSGSLRNVVATASRADNWLNPSVTETVGKAKGLGKVPAAAGAISRKTLGGMANIAPWVMGGHEALAAVEPMHQGKWSNYVDENGEIQEGATSRLINTAVLGGSLFGGPAARLAAGGLVAANPLQHVLLSDDEEAKYEAMQAAKANAPTLAAVQAAQAAQQPASPAEAGVAAAAPKPLTAVDMIVESLARADQGDNPVVYRETPEQAALVQQSANPNEQYEAFNPTISPELQVQREILQEQLREMQSRPRNTLKFADGLLGVPRYSDAEATRIAAQINALDQTVSQRQNTAQQDMQNRRTMHGFDKRNRIDLHVADQAADIDAAQLKETIRGNNITRASAAATLMRDMTKADLERQAKNYELAQKHFGNMFPEDTAAAAQAMDDFMVTQREAGGVNPMQLDSSDLASLLAQHNAGMKNVEAARSTAPFWSNTPITPYDAEFVQNGRPVRPWTNLFNEMANNNVGLGTGLRQEIKDIFMDPQMVDLRGGNSIPLQDSSGISRVQYAAMLQKAMLDPNLSPQDRGMIEAQIVQLMNQ